MPHPAVVQACLDRAMLRAGSLVHRAGTAALEELQADPKRREAAHEMQRRLHAWRGQFGEMLQRAIDVTAAAPERRREPAAALTLVDDEEILQGIESTRLAQQVLAQLERPVAELDALMCSALGQESIRPENNPLRPEVFAQALARMLGEDAPHPEWPSLWLRAMTQPLADELAQFYPECSALLIKSGVQAAGYRVVNRPAPKQAGTSRPTGAAGQAAPHSAHHAPQTAQHAPQTAAAPLPSGNTVFAQAISAFMQFAAHAARGPFVKDFLARDVQQAHQPLPAAYRARVEQELAALQESPDEPPHDPFTDLQDQALAPVDRPPRDVGTESPLTQEAWGELATPRRRALLRTQMKSEAQEVGQAIGLDLVRDLLDQVAQDPRLLSPVREAIVALEPALGRLALRSPRFFGEAENPARRLLETVAERSFRYNDQFSPEFEAFFADVRNGFNTLNALEEIADAAPFEQTLEELSQAWSAADREDEQRKGELLDAVRAAEKRQAEADTIATELSQRSDLEGTPGVVQDFLFERWSLVLAHARAAAGGRQVDPGGYVGVITDLLWSVKRDSALRDPARAFELIPRVVLKLRDGLTRIGQPPGDDDHFFRALEQLHRPVMKLRAKQRKQAMEPAPDGDAAQDLAPAAAQKPSAAEEPWLAPAELNACGYEDTELSTRAAKNAAELTPDEAESLLARLREGSWVDLYSKRKWRRAQLTWASSKGTLFMFVSHGGRPHSMTRRSLQRLLSARLVRPVADHEVVQHAIDILARPQPHAMAA